MEDEDVSDGPLGVDAEPAGTWMVPVTDRERWTKLALYIGIASALTAWLFYLQFRDYAPDQVEQTPYMLWGFGIFAIGMFAGVSAFGIRQRRVFDTIEVRYSPAQRLKRGSRWFVFGLAAVGLIWGVQLSNDQFATYWWYAWPALLPLMVGLGLYMLRKERVLSAAGKQARTELEGAHARANLERQAETKAVWGSGPARYVMAAAALYGSYYFAFEDRSDKNSDWLSVGLLILAMVLARELGLWVLGIGVLCLVGWAVFAGLAALPLSAAVILGAIIIALAVSKR